jgi:protein PhnA
MVSVHLAPNALETMDLCALCAGHLEDPKGAPQGHWRALAESIWSERNIVQAASYRILSQLRDQGWPAEILEMAYLEESVKDWAEAAVSDKHRDCFGAELQNGDSVVLIQSLDVKGSTLTAKKGTVVKNIRCVPDVPEHLEGRVEGQLIVILTKYVKRQG